MREERVALKHSVDVAVIRRERINPLPGHPYFAAIGALESGDQAKQRGFSGAALAENRQEFTGSHLKRDPAQHGAIAESFGDIANGKQSAHCAAFTSFQISVYFARRGTCCQK